MMTAKSIENALCDTQEIIEQCVIGSGQRLLWMKVLTVLPMLLMSP